MTKQMFKDLKYRNYTLEFVSRGEDITARIVTYSGADATFEKINYSTGKTIKVKVGCCGEVTLQEVRGGAAFKAR